MGETFPNGPEAFASYAERVFRTHWPDRPIEVAGAMDLIVEGRHLSLDNLWRLASRDPSRGEAIVHHYFEKLLEGDAMGNAAMPVLKNGGSMIGLSYYGAEKAVPGYNVMGVAKAALEAANRYLAMELGRVKNVRCNLVSAGPIKTLSAGAVGGFDAILDRIPQVAPLPRNITAAEVGDAAAFLLSDLSRGTTGQVLYVDSGYSCMGL